jgi:hypothetical protein
MMVEIKFVSYGGKSVITLGQGHSKKECRQIIGDTEPKQPGIYEFIVHTHNRAVFASNTDSLAVKKILDRIFE